MGLRIPSIRKDKIRTTKSGKQRRMEIVARRNARVHTISPGVDESDREHWPKGAVAANHELLRHINTYGYLPYFYVDKPFTCRACDAEEVWLATQQKWYYEVAKGHISATAIYCRSCRRKERERKVKAREVAEAGLIAKRMRPKS
jgi:hypothetical protein